MEYNKNIGILYDTIYYGILYFNKSSIIKKFEGQFDLDNAFNYFDEVSNSCYPLENCLLPFFYCDEITPCFISEYFRISLDFHKHTFTDFINSIQSTLKKSIINNLFANLTEIEKNLMIKRDSETINSAFKKLSWSMEMKNQTMFLLYNFDYTLRTLTKTLIKIHSHITTLHEKYKEKIIEKIADTQSKEIIILFEKLYSLDEKQLSRQIFSICFLNPFVILEKRDGYAESVFLCGYRYKEMLEATCTNKTTSLKTALFVLGDPIRFEIVMSIKKYGNLTMSELSRLNDISTSTSFKNVNILLEEMVIVRSRREGTRIYYRINNSYLRVIEKLFSKFINE